MGNYTQFNVTLYDTPSDGATEDLPLVTNHDANGYVVIEAIRADCGGNASLTIGWDDGVTLTTLKKLAGDEVWDMPLGRGNKGPKGADLIARVVATTPANEVEVIVNGIIRRRGD